MSTRNWFSIRNAAADTAEISIYDTIGLWGVSARDFIRDLKAITAKNIILRIHSPGGDVFEGNAIYNALKRHPAKITTEIDGLAASMASVIALVGNPVRMAANGMFMIHNVSGGGFGDAKKMRKAADLIEKVSESIISTYEEKTGLPREEIVTLMDEETWFTAEEALEKGFIDEISDAVEATAVADFDLSAFRKAPVIDNKKADMDLTAALAKITDLETEKTNLTNRATTAENKVTILEGEKTTLTDRATTAECKVTSLEGEKTTLTNEVKTLKDSAKTAEERAREIAASHGAGGTPKGEEGRGGNQGPDNKTTWDTYQTLMNEGKGAEASAYWDKHEKTLNDYAASAK